MKEHTLTKGSVGKGILLFVLPIIVGSLIQQLYVTIDAVVVGQFTGKLGLAAIDSVHTLFKFPLNFMNGLASGATIIISGHCGSKDEKQMHCSIRINHDVIRADSPMNDSFFMNLLQIFHHRA